MGNGVAGEGRREAGVDSVVQTGFPPTTVRTCPFFASLRWSREERTLSRRDGPADTGLALLRALLRSATVLARGAVGAGVFAAGWTFAASTASTDAARAAEAVA